MVFIFAGGRTSRLGCPSIIFALVCAVAGEAASAWAEPPSARFKDGLIFVNAELNGASGVFVLDTGSAVTILPPRFAEASGLRLGRRRRIDASGGDLGARQAEAG